ncbi:MAG: hypothetical protein ACREAR_01500 [Nitrosotalea sp.]
MEEFKPNIQVLVRLAEVFYENRSPKKTHLHFVSRTDWNSFERYMSWMKNKNYVECKIDGKEQKYQSTSMGHEMFDTILKLNEHVKTAKL